MTPGAAHWADAIDWSQPWLQPYRVQGERAARRAQAGVALHDALNAGCSAAALPVQFVPQQALPPGTVYERHIADSGCCPTRDNLHDFFNGLVWLHWPHSKQRLGMLQAAEIAARGVGPERGPLRDALTLFDENGALLMAPRDMWDALAARDWKTLFVTRRGRWAQARLLLFGHALLEKLAAPRKPITAHVYQGPDALESIADADRWLADAMQAEQWSAKPFAPLPVLGVPGWWGGNADDCFYDDPLVFRPAGTPHTTDNRVLPARS